MPKAAHDHRLWRSSGEFPGGAPFRTLFKRTFSRIFPALRPKHPFDLVHRVDTSGLMYAESLLSGHRHDQQSEGYYATAPSLFRGVIGAWRATLSSAGSNLNGYTLFDIG